MIILKDDNVVKATVEDTAQVRLQLFEHLCSHRAWVNDGKEHTITFTNEEYGCFPATYEFTVWLDMYDTMHTNGRPEVRNTNTVCSEHGAMVKMNSPRVECSCVRELASS